MNVRQIFSIYALVSVLSVYAPPPPKRAWFPDGIRLQIHTVIATLMTTGVGHFGLRIYGGYDEWYDIPSLAGCSLLTVLFCSLSLKKSHDITKKQVELEGLKARASHQMAWQQPMLPVQSPCNGGRNAGAVDHPDDDDEPVLATQSGLGLEAPSSPSGGYRELQS